MSDKQPCVYIIASGRNGTLYVGVTSNLTKRIDEHRQSTDGFTARYKIHTLVYAEQCDSMRQAITREKQIKGGSRKKKLELIEKINPHWEDLSGWV